MTVTIPDEALGELRLTSAQTRVEIAVGLFADGRVTLARGAKITGVPFVAFQRELARRKMPLHYDVAEFEADVKTLAEMDARGSSSATRPASQTCSPSGGKTCCAICLARW